MTAVASVISPEHANQQKLSQLEVQPPNPPTKPRVA
jgi:hypothetical protein